MKTTTLLPLAIAFISLDLAISESNGATIDRDQVAEVARARLGTDAPDSLITQFTTSYSASSASSILHPFTGISESNG